MRLAACFNATVGLLARAQGLDFRGRLRTHLLVNVRLP